MQKWLSIAVCAGLLLASTPSMAGNLYYWVTEEGTHAYSDALKRVPNRYRAQAQRSPLPELESYDRWTPSDRTATGSYASRLTENLERLRKINAGTSPAQGTPAPAGAIAMQLGAFGPGLQFGVPTAQAAGEPVVVQSARTRLPGDRATRNLTYVQQGAETLAVIVDQDNDSEIVQLSAQAVERLLQRR
jgi:hypothetical protein